MPPIPMWEPHQFVADALMLQNDVGDVQTALTILIVMGEARQMLPIEDAVVVSVFMKHPNLEMYFTFDSLAIGTLVSHLCGSAASL